MRGGSARFAAGKRLNRKEQASVFQQSVAVDQIAVHDEAGDAAGVPDVQGGVAVDDEDVGAASGGDLAQLVPAELEAVVVGGGGQGLAWRKPQADKQLQLSVHGNAGQGALDRRSGGGQIVREGGKEGFVDAPQAEGRLLALLALALFHVA